MIKPTRPVVAGVLVVTWALAAGQASRRALEAFDLEVSAPERLADTGLYEEGSSDRIDPRNRPFSPQYPLWSDGAAKSRWVYLPEGSTIDVTDPGAWDFPVGTKFWKEFSFEGRKVETRFLWKTGSDQWTFASYAWNPEGTDAIKAPDEGIAGVAEVAPGKRHSVPSVDECRACHDSGRTEILGFNALQLSTDRDPNAIHGEPLEPGMVTLETLTAAQLLQPPRPELVSDPPRIVASTPEERAVLGYLAGNCGSCHNRRSDLAPLGLHWQARELAADGRDIARGMMAHSTKWQVPEVPEGETLLVDAASPEKSALLKRMRSRRPASQMPPVGTVLMDREGVDAVTKWIESQAASTPQSTARR